jgi:threonine/homoserine/homoserine lactone efflux protein
MEYFNARVGVYLAVATLLIVTPGPDTALVTRNALLAGKRAASFTTLGIGTGSILWALASGLGSRSSLRNPWSLSGRDF